MAVELSSGYVSATVRFDGVNKGISKLFDNVQKQAIGAAKKTGSAYAKALADEAKTAADQVKKISETVAKSRDKEADAAGKLKVALEKLNEARAGGLSGSKLTQLEEQHESAMRRQAAAAKELARETDALTQAQKRQDRAQDALSGASSKPSGGLLSRWRKNGADSGRAFNDAAARELGGGRLSGAASSAGASVKSGFLRAVGSAAALAAPIAGVGSILSAGFGRLQSIDAAKVKLTALGNSAETVDTIMKSALDSVKGTAYGLGDAATIAASATAAGVKPGKELTKYLTTTADAAAIAGTSLSDMGRIFNQVQTGQAAYTEDLNQLSERGIPIYQWLANEAGVAAADVKKMASEGQISSELFFKAINKNVGGAAKTIGETSFSGAVDNLKAAAGRLGADILGPVFEKIPGIVRDLTPTFDRLGGAIKPVVQSIVDGFGPTMQRIVDLFQRWQGIILPLVAAFAGYKTVMVAITVATKVWAAAQLALNAVLALNPIGLVVAAIAGLVAGIVLLYKKNETFRNIVQTTWNAIKVAIGAVWGWIINTVVPALKTAWDVISTGALALWQNAIQPAWNGIKQVIGFAWEIISDIFNNWKIAMGLVGSVATELWQTYIAPAWEGIKSAFSAAWDFIAPIFENVKGAFSSTGNFIKGVWNGVAGVIKSAFDGIVNAVKPGLHMLGSMLAAIPSNLGPFDIPGADTARAWGQKLQAFRGGGLVRGPGTGTSDSVLAWLSNGEGVVTAKGMSNGGGAVVAALNAGWTPSADYLRGMLIPGFAEGLNPGADYLRSMVMKLWPSITTIGGRRSEDGFGEHSSGNAIDIMIPGWDTPQGKALGDAVAAFIAKNASALGLDGFIWRQQSYGYGGSLTSGKQMPDRGSSTQNHMDHVHVMLGKGRGAGAAAVGLPTSSISLPSGGGSVSALGFGGSSGSAGSSGASPKQVREADDRINDLSNRLDVTEQELADLESNPKAKETTKQRKRDMVDKLKRDLQQAKDDRNALGSSGSGGGFGGGNNPYAKIAEGLAEIMPDAGGLADIGIGGLKESLLPPGFSDPTQWGLVQAGSTLLKFFGGLRNNSDGKPLLGEGGALFANIAGSAMTGSGSGIVDAIKTIIPAPFGSMDAAQLQGAPGDINPVIAGAQIPGTGFGDMGSAFSSGSAGPAQSGNGANVDQSINFNAPVGTGVDQAMQKSQSAQNQQWRQNFGTRTGPVG